MRLPLDPNPHLLPLLSSASLGRMLAGTALRQRALLPARQARSSRGLSIRASAVKLPSSVSKASGWAPHVTQTCSWVLGEGGRAQ